MFVRVKVKDFIYISYLKSKIFPLNSFINGPWSLSSQVCLQL